MELNQKNTIDSMIKTDANNKKATISLIIGLIGIVTWVLPIVGLPLAIVGIVFARKGMNSNKKRIAQIGLILCILSFFATFANASIGVYQASVGKNVFINEVLN